MPRIFVKRVVAAACGGLAAAAACAALAQTASSGIYSKAQAARGAELFAAQCARCHGAAMEGLDVAPALTGGVFSGHWSGQPVAELAARIRTTMPLDMPGTLGQAAAADLTAAVLEANGYPAGAGDMPVRNPALQAMTIDAPPPAGK